MFIQLFGFNPPSNVVTYYQNAASLTVSLLSFASLIWFPDMFNTVCKIIAVQLSVDILFATREYCLHHVIGLLALIPYFLFNMQDDISVFLIRQGIMIETSTIFYTLIFFLENAKHKSNVKTFLISICRSAFLYTFVKYRLVDFYYQIVINPDCYQWYPQFEFSYIPLVCKHASITGMFALNLYWFIIILKKTYKALCNPINRFEYGEYILQYTAFGNSYIAYRVYSPYMGSRFHYYWFDIIGLSLVSITSYYYHRSNYESLISNGDRFDCVDRSRLKPFIRDMMSIHVRVFLTLFTNMLAANRVTYWIYLSFIFNLLGAFNIKRVLTAMSDRKDKFVYSEIHHPHNKQLSVLGGVPIMIDALYLIYNSNGLYLKCCNLTILYLIVLVTAMKPFYKLNHTLVHILLLIQTYYICKTNVYVANIEGK
jgi:hypothetical protein